MKMDDTAKGGIAISLWAVAEMIGMCIASKDKAIGLVIMVSAALLLFVTLYYSAREENREKGIKQRLDNYIEHANDEIERSRHYEC